MAYKISELLVKEKTAPSPVTRTVVLNLKEVKTVSDLFDRAKERFNYWKEHNPEYSRKMLNYDQLSLDYKKMLRRRNQRSHTRHYGFDSSFKR